MVVTRRYDVPLGCSHPVLHTPFFFNDTAPTEIYTLSLHDALPIRQTRNRPAAARRPPAASWPCCGRTDRKSTRLNSSHITISYAVFCLKKKTNGAIDDTCRVVAQRRHQHRGNQGELVR